MPAIKRKRIPNLYCLRVHFDSGTAAALARKKTPPVERKDRPVELCRQCQKPCGHFVAQDEQPYPLRLNDFILYVNEHNKPNQGFLTLPKLKQLVAQSTKVRNLYQTIAQWIDRYNRRRGPERFVYAISTSQTKVLETEYMSQSLATDESARELVRPIIDVALPRAPKVTERHG